MKRSEYETMTGSNDEKSNNIKVEKKSFKTGVWKKVRYNLIQITIKNINDISTEHIEKK